jgi:flagellar biosynthesis/type III secretory pathway protein FliH
MKPLGLIRKWLGIDNETQNTDDDSTITIQDMLNPLYDKAFRQGFEQGYEDGRHSVFQEQKWAAMRANENPEK